MQQQRRHHSCPNAGQGFILSMLAICRPRTSEWSSVEEVDKDNSELLDAGAATQQLSTDDIAAMRAAGKTGEEIVAALAEGSATFLNKTQFSQAKYKKKKQKKYSVFATLQRPSARSICEVRTHCTCNLADSCRYSCSHAQL